MTREEKIRLLANFCLENSACTGCPLFFEDEGGNCEAIRNRLDETLDENLRTLGVDPATGENLEEVTADNVNHPQHYELPGGLECFDVMLATHGKEAMESYCLVNAFKYLFRCKRKNGDEDVEKARWYLNKWHELHEEGGDR